MHHLNQYHHYLLNSERIFMTRLYCLIFSSGLIFFQSLNGPIHAQVATVADAKQALDLTTFPAFDPEGPIMATVAMQRYEAKGDPEAIAKKVRTALVEKGCQELDGATFTPAYCSAVYNKDGFHFVLSAMPSKPKTAQVTITNLGNLDFRTLPIAKLGKELFVQPASANFTSEDSVANTRASCRQSLEAEGWEWFGDTSASFYMRKNAVRLQVMCSESPREKGQTMIQVSAEQMSSALPLIPDLVRIDYTEPTGRLDGDSQLSPAELASELRKTLEQNGWKATTKEPLKIDFRETLIFRNAEEELVELQYHSVDAISRFEMKYMTAEQVADENRRAQAAVEKAKEKMAAEEERLKNPTAILLDPLGNAKVKESKPQLVELTASSGQARSIIAKWISKQKSAGWSVETTIDSKETGDYTLTKDDQKIYLTFLDPGFVPAEITVKTTKGFKIEFNK